MQVETAPGSPVAPGQAWPRRLVPEGSEHWLPSMSPCKLSAPSQAGAPQGADTRISVELIMGFRKSAEAGFDTQKEIVLV